MPRRSPLWIWIGRAVFAAVLAALISYLVAAGLDKADKLGSGISVVIALIALVAPYLLPPRSDSPAPPASPASSPTSVHAAGPSSVAIGGDNRGQVSTSFSGPV